MRRSLKTPTAVRIGRLSEETRVAAEKIYRTLVEGPRLVWVDDADDINSSDPENAVDIPPSWMCGTYSFGHPVQAIIDDLREFVQERAKLWIVH